MRDLIFKGCTRPPMLFGIPYVPLIVLCGVLFLAGIWGSFLCGIAAPLFALAIGVPLVSAMKTITAVDDQRLVQWVSRLRLDRTPRLLARGLHVYGHTSRGFQ